MRTLIIISSKSPNSILYGCISNLYNIQIGCSTGYKVCVVDSDSDDLSVYDRIRTDYPQVDLHLCKNRNYEYGAWKYALNLYPDYDVYVCLQDSILLKRSINLTLVNDSTAYTFHNCSGFNFHPSLKSHALTYLKDSDIEYESVFHGNFMLAQHSVFIVTNNVINDIFTTFKYPAIGKDGSCSYERIFGLYFLHKKITTVALNDIVEKYNGRRV